MASVLPLPHHPPSPLDRSIAEPFCLRSQESVSSQFSMATKRHTRQRSHTVAWPLSDETNRLASRSVLNYIRDVGHSAETLPSPSKSLSLYEIPRDQECDADLQPPTVLATRKVQASGLGVEPFPPLEPTAIDHTCQHSECNEVVDETDTVRAVGGPSPFKRWLSNLRNRHSSTENPRGTTRELGQLHSPQSRHLKTTSLSSSVGVLTAVKSATLTLAGTSIAPSTQERQNYLQSDAASMSFRGPRLSIDSASLPVEHIVDSRAWYRSIQRRNVVEEIVESEESYISDMKAMIHVLSTNFTVTETSLMTLRCTSPSWLLLLRYPRSSASLSRNRSAKSSTCTRPFLQSYRKWFPLAQMRHSPWLRYLARITQSIPDGTVSTMIPQPLD
jgi:hypothetical protein